MSDYVELPRRDTDNQFTVGGNTDPDPASSVVEAARDLLYAKDNGTTLSPASAEWLNAIPPLALVPNAASQAHDIIYRPSNGSGLDTSLITDLLLHVRFDAEHAGSTTIPDLVGSYDLTLESAFVPNDQPRTGTEVPYYCQQRGSFAAPITLATHIVGQKYTWVFVVNVLYTAAEGDVYQPILSVHDNPAGAGQPVKFGTAIDAYAANDPDVYVSARVGSSTTYGFGALTGKRVLAIYRDDTAATGPHCKWWFDGVLNTEDPASMALAAAATADVKARFLSDYKTDVTTPSANTERVGIAEVLLIGRELTDAEALALSTSGTAGIVQDHRACPDLEWMEAGHRGTVGALAAFGRGGQAAEVAVGTDGQVLTTQANGTWAAETLAIDRVQEILAAELLWGP